MLCSLANALGGKFKKNASKMAFKMVSTQRRKMVSLARGTEVVAGFLMTVLKAGVARVARNVVSEAAYRAYRESCQIFSSLEIWILEGSFYHPC